LIGNTPPGYLFLLVSFDVNNIKTKTKQKKNDLSNKNSGQHRIKTIAVRKEKHPISFSN
jgi:hypothetical protein